jgi:hypothetical protein
MAYGKIFESLYTGSMVGSGLNVFALWTYVIANAKPPGTIELNPILLSAIFGCTLAEVEDALRKLCEPDPRSRTPDFEGRRLIQEGQFLYFVPTWAKYNKLRNEIERREQNRLAQKRWREKQKSLTVSTTLLTSAESAHADADTYSENKEDEDGGRPLQEAVQKLTGKLSRRLKP